MDFLTTLSATVIGGLTVAFTVPWLKVLWSDSKRRLRLLNLFQAMAFIGAIAWSVYQLFSLMVVDGPASRVETLYIAGYVGSIVFVLMLWSTSWTVDRMLQLHRRHLDAMGGLVDVVGELAGGPRRDKIATRDTAERSPPRDPLE